MVHNVVTELFQSGLHEYPINLYYSGIPTSHWRNRNIQYTSGLGNWLNNNWKPVKDSYLSVRVKCSELDSKRAAESLACHWSQFTTDEIEDMQQWMKAMNKNDTVYLRPFLDNGMKKYSIVD